MDSMPEENELKISVRGIDYTGYSSVCSLASVRWAKAHKAERADIQKTYYEKNKEALKAKRRARYAKRKLENK